MSVLTRLPHLPAGVFWCIPSGEVLAIFGDFWVFSMPESRWGPDDCHPLLALWSSGEDRVVELGGPERLLFNPLPPLPPRSLSPVTGEILFACFLRHVFLVLCCPPRVRVPFLCGPFCSQVTTVQSIRRVFPTSHVFTAILLFLRCRFLAHGYFQRRLRILFGGWDFPLCNVISVRSVTRAVVYAGPVLSIYTSLRSRSTVVLFRFAGGRMSFFPSLEASGTGSLRVPVVRLSISSLRGLALLCIGRNERERTRNPHFYGLPVLLFRGGPSPFSITGRSPTLEPAV